LIRSINSLHSEKKRKKDEEEEECPSWLTERMCRQYNLSTPAAVAKKVREYGTYCQGDEMQYKFCKHSGRCLTITRMQCEYCNMWLCTKWFPKPRRICKQCLIEDTSDTEQYDELNSEDD